MRNRLAVVLVVLALLMPAAGFGANKEGPYASIGGAIVMTNDAKARDDIPGVRVSGKWGLKTGFGFTLAGGYALGNGLRSELELGYWKADVESLTLDPVTRSVAPPSRERLK